MALGTAALLAAGCSSGMGALNDVTSSATYALTGVSTGNVAVDATAPLNRLRKEAGRKPLARDAAAQRAARYQAKVMAERLRMKHELGPGLEFTTRIKKAGIRGAAGENIAVGQRDVPAVLRAWMNSSGHRKNMLSPKFNGFGLASAEGSDGRLYWAMILVD